MSDSKILHYKVYTPEVVNRVVVIAHGMTEHSGRYEQFAKFLEKKGVAVVVYDQRCHGKSTQAEDIGHLPAKNGFDRVTTDLHEVIRFTKRVLFPNKPIFLIGHSFGSFVAQNYLENYDDGLAGVFLLGTAGPKLATMFFGRMLAWFVKLFKGEKKTSKLLHNVMHGSYNDKFPNETEYAWLSRDIEVQKAYIADPLCGFEPTIGFRYTFLDGLYRIHLDKNIKRIKDLTIHILAGDMDPVGGYGKSVQKLYETLKKHGKHTVLHLYKDARHEVLNELNKSDVYTDIANCLDV